MSAGWEQQMDNEARRWAEEVELVQQLFVDADALEHYLTYAQEHDHDRSQQFDL